MALNLTYAENQPFTIYTTSGEAIPCSLGELRLIMNWAAQTTIIAAIQAGAALATLLVLLLVTKSEKRRHWAFWTNAFALLMTVVAQSINCAYFLDGWFDPYPVLTGIPAQVSRTARAASIFGGFCVVLLVLAVEISLLLQVHAITITLPYRTRLYILVFGGALALVAIALRLAQFIDSTIVQDIRGEYSDDSALLHARDIALTLSVVFFSTVFVVKLGAAIRQRRVLGMPRANRMQVLFVGFTQTMLLPALFAACQFAAPDSTIDELVLTSVAMCLPLTAISAAFVVDGPPSLSAGPEVRRMVMVRSDQDQDVSGKYGTVASISAGSEVELRKL